MAARKEIAEYAGIQQSYTSILTESAGPGLPETAGLPYAAADFDALLRENPDTVGWLAIPGTDISYPVLRAADNNKYLHTSFGGARSGAGALFMDSNNAVNPLGQNTIVYGHNMGAGREREMFGPLLRYDAQDFFDTHRWIQFDTIHNQYGWWQVFAVIHLDAAAGSFDCYKQNFEDAAGFEAWIAQAKALSLYDTGTDVPAGASILTLSTCNRNIGYGANGRQIILAVNMGGDGQATSGQFGPK